MQSQPVGRLEASASPSTTSAIQRFPTTRLTPWSEKNGESPLTIDGAGYQVLLTVDQETPRQQTMMGAKFSTIQTRSRTPQLEDLSPQTAAMTETWEFIPPGKILPIANETA